MAAGLDQEADAGEVMDEIWTMFAMLLFVVIGVAFLLMRLFTVT